MKKVLIITYYWPPASGPGVFRFLKFAKYFPAYGYEPHILTVKNGSYPSTDESLMQEIDPGLKVYKTSTLEPFTLFNKLSGKKGKSIPVGIAPRKDDSLIKKWMFYIRANFFIPDARKGWNRFAFKKATQVIKQEQIPYVITTGPPHSTHLIGLKLKKTCDVKWIADMRDPWTSIFYNQFFPRTKKTKDKDFGLESSVLQHADLVTVVSNGIKKEFEERARKIEIIPNGFDMEDIAPRENEKTDSFVLSYVGNFKTTQNIESIWQALSEMKSEVGGFAGNFKLRFTGNCVPEALSKIKEYKLEDMVEIEGHVEHRVAVERMRNANLLLFIIPRSENNHLIITGKLFEYLATRAPVLSIGPLDGDAGRILKEQQRDRMIDYGDKEEFKKLVLKYYQKWLDDKKLVVAPMSDLKKYSREGLTRKLASILDSL